MRTLLLILPVKGQNMRTQGVQKRSNFADFLYRWPVTCSRFSQHAKSHLLFGFQIAVNFIIIRNPFQQLSSFERRLLDFLFSNSILTIKTIFRITQLS